MTKDLHLVGFRIGRETFGVPINLVHEIVRVPEITHEINSSVEEQASGAEAVVRSMEKMRELVQRSTSGSTELAASADQMSKMARTLLESMDRFILETLAAHRLESEQARGSNGSTGNNGRYAVAAATRN